MKQKIEINIDGVTYICTPKEEVKEEHEYIDLGLPSGRLWATCNIGAKKPTDSGDYFAWGATKPYNLDDCNTDNYKNTEAARITEIDDEHDAATILWGKEWRMPKLTDFAELIEHTEFDFVENDELNYAVYTSKINGKKLIFPAAGDVYGGTLYGRGSDGHYWSRTRYSSANAWSLHVNSGGQYVYYGNRFYGFSVRPVRR